MKRAFEALEIAVVDANATQRHDTELVLRSWGHRVVARAGSPEAAFEVIAKRWPHVALVGVDLSDASGIRLVRRLLAVNPGLGVVLVLGRSSAHELEDAMACGARGITLRSGEVAELASALAIVGAGGRYVAPSVERRVQALAQLRVLSKPEREVLQLLADGVTGAQAAIQLAASPETVRNHIRNAMRKLRARTRVHAVTIALKRREIWS
jgi:DNA-binding NarL/FixJ family response regulator